MASLPFKLKTASFNFLLVLILDYSPMGNAVILESDVLDANGNYLYTRYMHMNSSSAGSPFYFSNGDSVSAGDPIGFVGNTGDSKGFHLYFDVNAKKHGKYYFNRKRRD